LVALACALGCGTQDSPGNPPAHAPFAGSTGYRKVAGVFVLLDPSVDVTDPTVVADSPDGPFAIWVTYGGAEIRRADLSHLGTDPSPLRPALSPAEPWEGARVAAPSVVRNGTGYQMAYEAADGVLATAESQDGEHWSDRRQVGRGKTPALAGGRLFYVDQLDGQIWSGATPTGIRGGAPDVIARPGADGRIVWQLFFECPGTGGLSIGICYAGSFDGTSFRRTALPIFSPDVPDERGPAAVLGVDHATLFFAQQPTGFPVRIGAAVAP
jgi:hypothetical protein